MNFESEGGTNDNHMNKKILFFFKGNSFYFIIFLVSVFQVQINLKISIY